MLFVVSSSSGSLVAHELAVLPLSFVNAPRFVYKFAVARSLTIQPISDVEISIRVNESTKTIVNVVLELSFVDDMVDLFADASDLSVWTNLTNDILVESALAELSVLVDGFLRVLDNVLKAQGSKLIPLVLGSLKSDTV